MIVKMCWRCGERMRPLPDWNNSGYFNFHCSHCGENEWVRKATPNVHHSQRQTEIEPEFASDLAIVKAEDKATWE